MDTYRLVAGDSVELVVDLHAGDPLFTGGVPEERLLVYLEVGQADDASLQLDVFQGDEARRHRDAVHRRQRATRRRIALERRRA